MQARVDTLIHDTLRLVNDKKFLLQAFNFCNLNSQILMYKKWVNSKHTPDIQVNDRSSQYDIRNSKEKIHCNPKNYVRPQSISK